MFICKSHYQSRQADLLRQKRLRPGFTLIELLVVITVIAILVSMLIPMIGIIRFSANGSVCVNRQKQTTLGILAYANDNDGELPYVQFPASQYYQGKQLNDMGFSCSTSVNGMIYPYVESMKIALCASDFQGNAGAFHPDWGQHKLPCPDPIGCRGRSNSYGAWVGNEADSTTHIMNDTHGCLVSQYVQRMKQSYFIGGPVVVPTNRFTGRTAAGAVPPAWCWNEVWGSTLLSEMWGGTHKYGTRRGSAQTNIDGAGRFRTYNQSEINQAPFKQFSRYEED